MQQLNFSDISLSNTKDSQNRKILDALKQGRRLTPLDILNEFGCLRASGRIFDLRHGEYDGVEYPIEREMVRVPSGKVVASYFLKKQEQNSGGVAG